MSLFTVNPIRARTFVLYEKKVGEIDTSDEDLFKIYLEVRSWPTQMDVNE